MRLPRDLKPKELIKALEVLEYDVSRQEGSHIRITTSLNGKHHEVIPNHVPIKIGTLQSILRSIALHHNITVQDLLIKLKL